MDMSKINEFNREIERAVQNKEELASSLNNAVVSTNMSMSYLSLEIATESLLIVRNCLKLIMHYIKEKQE